MINNSNYDNNVLIIFHYIDLLDANFVLGGYLRLEKILFYIFFNSQNILSILRLSKLSGSKSTAKISDAYCQISKISSRGIS